MSKGEARILTLALTGNGGSLKIEPTEVRGAHSSAEVAQAVSIVREAMADAASLETADGFDAYLDRCMDRYIALGIVSELVARLEARTAVFTIESP